MIILDPKIMDKKLYDSIADIANWYISYNPVGGKEQEMWQDIDHDFNHKRKPYTVPTTLEEYFVSSVTDFFDHGEIPSEDDDITREILKKYLDEYLAKCILITLGSDE